MRFTIRANSGRPGEGSFRVEKSTRGDALDAAVGLLGLGKDGVTITDDAGRIFKPSEFCEFFEEGM